MIIISLNQFNTPLSRVLDETIIVCTILSYTVVKGILSYTVVKGIYKYEQSDNPMIIKNSCQ